jgi:hypothetical protein
VAAQAEGLEPGLAEAAQAGRRSDDRPMQVILGHAATDGLLADGLDAATFAVVTAILIWADTVVHIQRAHGWSASHASVPHHRQPDSAHTPARLIRPVQKGGVPLSSASPHSR